MKLFLAFIVLCIAGGLVLRNKNVVALVALLIGVSLFAAFGYYFLNQI